jgi:hypothetical protein
MSIYSVGRSGQRQRAFVLKIRAEPFHVTGSGKIKAEAAANKGRSTARRISVDVRLRSQLEINWANRKRQKRPKNSGFLAARQRKTTLEARPIVLFGSV